MGFAPGRGSVAAEGGAATVAGRERDPLGVGVETAFAADVEDLGSTTQHDRDDPGLTGQLAGQTGADQSAGVEAGCLRPPIRVSRVIVTTTVAHTPPASGIRSVG